MFEVYQSRCSVPEVKTIVCLANSRKHSGRCIAGREILPNGFGAWIRPVSTRASSEVSEEERRYDNGASPQVLDIIEIRLIAPAPQLHQTENYTIDAGRYWIKKGEFPRAEIPRLLDPPAPLWANDDSTYNGHNDRVKVDIAAKLNHSLVLIAPEDLTLKVLTEGATIGNPRRRLRADFMCLGRYYCLIVTDPVAERALLAKSNQDYEMPNTYLCVSLSEPYTDLWCYKLVPTVIGPAPL